MLKKYTCLLLALLLSTAMILPSLVSCELVESSSVSDKEDDADDKDDKDDKDDNDDTDKESEKTYKNISELVADRVNSKRVTDFEETDKITNYVKITVAGHGDIVLELIPKTAPITVKNFQKLVSEGFYDGLTFHRIYKDFMIQGGDPDGNSQGSSDTSIKGEFASNGVENNLKHLRGVISMARGTEPDSASCQFFICDATSEHLDGNYASFGYVIAGMETVDSIAAVEVQANATGEKSDPIKDVIIEKMVFVNPS